MLGKVNNLVTLKHIYIQNLTLEKCKSQGAISGHNG